mgnify:CR=1 FL=1
MNCKVKNTSNLDFQQFLPLLKSFLPFAAQNMGFSRPPSVVFASDEANSELPLGQTAHYEPSTYAITVYTDGRHVKDILRSLAHELVHHKQNCDGEFEKLGSGAGTEPGYAQKDPHLRNMEEEAYLKGNLCFRDWEDTHKKQLQESIYYNAQKGKGDIKMSYKNWRNQEVNNRLMESWGFKKLNEEEDSPPLVPKEETFGTGLGKAAGTIPRKPSDELKRQKKEKVYIHPISGEEVARPEPGSEQHKTDSAAHAMRQPLPSQQAKARKRAWTITKQHAAKERAGLEEQEKFPDLTGDGKVTQADILKGKGVIKEDGVAVHKFAAGDTISDVLAAQGHDPSMTQKIVDYHNWRAESDPSLQRIDDINKIAVGGNLMLPGEQAMMAIQAGDYQTDAVGAHGVGRDPNPGEEYRQLPIDHPEAASPTMDEQPMPGQPAMDPTGSGGSNAPGMMSPPEEAEFTEEPNIPPVPMEEQKQELQPKKIDEKMIRKVVKKALENVYTRTK